MYAYSCVIYLFKEHPRVALDLARAGLLSGTSTSHSRRDRCANSTSDSLGQRLGHLCDKSALLRSRPLKICGCDLKLLS